MLRHCMQLAVELDDQRDENDARQRQLDAARIEIKAIQDTHTDCGTLRRDLANARTQLEALKADPLYDQLQRAARHVTDLEQRLNSMQQARMAADRPY